MSNKIFSTRNVASLLGIFLVYFFIICLSDNIKGLAVHVSHCKALHVHCDHVNDFPVVKGEARQIEQYLPTGFAKPGRKVLPPGKARAILRNIQQYYPIPPHLRLGSVSVWNTKNNDTEKYWKYQLIRINFWILSIRITSVQSPSTSIWRMKWNFTIST